jgi:RNA polymerase sigma factor (TIGR02999 family)
MSNEVRRDELEQLLDRWTKGDQEAFKSLVILVYGELRRLARYRLRHDRPDHTLRTTALVHEAYVRLAQHPPRTLNDRKHFLALAAGVMRRVLVDYARKKAAKREPRIKLELQPEMVSVSARDVDFLSLDRALNGLAKLDDRQSKIVELRFFAGLSIEETSEVLGVATATVKRDWITARAWLRNEMSREELSTGERQSKQVTGGS